MPFKNKEDYKKNWDKRVQRNKNYIKEYLKDRFCVDGGEDNPIVLEFDHLRDKKYLVSDLSYSVVSLETLKNEIAKCEIRCANCHRLITHYRKLIAKYNT